MPDAPTGAPNGAPTIGTPRGVSKVFLSSTVEDLEPLRNQVLDVALRKAETYCWLSDVSGSNDYEPTEAYCKRMLQDSHGYILVSAHFYGSVPPGEALGRSITHLEFVWACERWFGQPGNAMTVLMPKQGSKVDLELQQAAERIVAKRGLNPADHSQQLQTFKTQVTGVATGWRKVASFDSEQELREQALVACYRIRGGTHLQAAAHPAPISAAAQPLVAAFHANTVGDAELGALGRSAQVASMLRAVNTLNAAEHPALLVLVHGDKNAGHRIFIDHLFSDAHRSHLQDFKPIERRNQLPATMAGLDAVCQWLAKSLRLPSGADTPEGVAERCHAGLAQRSMGLVIDGIGNFAGGVVAFHTQFWQPFFARLAALNAAQPGPHRLLVLAATRNSDSLAWAALARDTREDAEDETPGSPQDRVKSGALLWPLPRLNAIKPEHVERWFNDMQVAKEPLRRRQIIQQLLNSEGEPDNVPQNVVDRLRGLLDSGEIPFQQEP